MQCLRLARLRVTALRIIGSCARRSLRRAFSCYSLHLNLAFPQEPVQFRNRKDQVAKHAVWRDQTAFDRPTQRARVDSTEIFGRRSQLQATDKLRRVSDTLLLLSILPILRSLGPRLLLLRAFYHSPQLLFYLLLHFRDTFHFSC